MSYNAIVIAGPTGVGKTALSLKLAKILDADIISADSMQIYKGLDIGTAKILPDEMEGIKHYMLDIVNPDEYYSVGDFEKDANNILNTNYKNYLVVGGTGLYISSLTDGFSDLPEKNNEIRDKLEKMELSDLVEELKKVDEETYNTIDKLNKVRVVRALEIYYISGQKMSEIVKKNNKNNDYNFLKIFLTRDREELYGLINKRIDIMIEKGLIEEAKYIFNKYPDNKSIGYKELFGYFKGEITLNEAVDLIKQKSRNYAKRQMTWFNKRNDYIIYNMSELSEEYIIEDILKKFKRGK